MSWTITCFCGTLYTTPPGRCPACGEPLEHFEEPISAPPSDEPPTPEISREMAAFRRGSPGF